jgi:hypothetical protein
VGRKEK